ncbi:hypothetical protein BACI71_40649 [Bacillus mycoides]|uniref:Uncharacterized protein n=1 Tax=Bacillus mycoides TaxID=1405 RepID=A0A654AGC3_BACMY|nr:hypothetical protein BACI71_40649 [Bacillus mycoides]
MFILLIIYNFVVFINSPLKTTPNLHPLMLKYRKTVNISYGGA